MIAKVAVEKLPINADIEYEYRIPNELKDDCVLGSRVIVPFSKSNVKRRAIILEVSDEEKDNLKSIIEVIDKTPLLSKEFIKLSKFMAKKYFSSVYDCIDTMIPRGKKINLICKFYLNEHCEVLSDEEKELIEYIKQKEAFSKDELAQIDNKILKSLLERNILRQEMETKFNISDASETVIELVSREKAEDYLQLCKSKYVKHIEPVELLLQVNKMFEKDLIYMTGVSKSIINTLQKRNIINKYQVRKYRSSYNELNESNDTDFILNEEQKAAADGIYQNYKKGYNVSLLRGVTGSGKTHVFFDLCDRVLKDNKQIIILMPEISIAAHMLIKFYNRYGQKVTVLHSGLSDGERADQYERIVKNEVSIVIGTRSAVFAPFSKLGMIIIDEEQEHTYKSDTSPKYHAREIALFRGKLNKACVVLSSATPSFETYAKAKKNIYSLFELNQRYNNYSLPDVEIADMRAELKSGNSSVISNRLKDMIYETLLRKEQAILFINRRGYYGHVTCKNCGYVPMCDNCSISYTYHKQNNRLMCHYCQSSIKMPDVCPVCKSEHIKYFGFGTQKAEEEIKALFPNASVLRMDSDTTSKINSHEKMLEKFKAGEYDILIGTQMVTKGLDFFNVTLVGVLAADMSLFSEDYRAGEKTFSLITQVIGRAGRGEKPGYAIIQTYNPDNPVLLMSLKQDFKVFFDDQIKYRKLMTYPPYCDLCQIVFSSTDENEIIDTSKEFCQIMKALILKKYQNLNIIMYGPSSAQIYMVNKKYRIKILIKCKANVEFYDFIYEAMSNIKNKNVISIDINPNQII